MKNIGSITHTALAEMADVIDPREMAEAMEKDAAESDEIKALRSIMSSHRFVASAIYEIRCCREAQGNPLSARGQHFLRQARAEGRKWYIPQPAKKEQQAIGLLRAALVEKAARWDRFQALATAGAV